MKRLLTVLTLTVLLALGMAGPAWASCTTHTYFLNGRMVMCTVCCAGSHCSTTCF